MLGCVSGALHFSILNVYSEATYCPLYLPGPFRIQPTSLTTLTCLPKLIPVILLMRRGGDRKHIEKKGASLKPENHIHIALLKTQGNKAKSMFAKSGKRLIGYFLKSNVITYAQMQYSWQCPF